MLKFDMTSEIGMSSLSKLICDINKDSQILISLSPIMYHLCCLSVYWPYQLMQQSWYSQS